MAGVKGRSGGARPGAGRKAKPPVLLPVELPADASPLDVLLAIARCQSIDVRLRMSAARGAAPFVHPRLAHPGKKAAADARAAALMGGRLAPGAPPGGKS